MNPDDPPESVRDYIDRRLTEGYRFHSECPECTCPLVDPPGKPEGTEGAWCPLCGYSRPTTLRPHDPQDESTSR